MRQLMRPLALISILLLVPVVPFLLLGSRLEPLFATWAEHWTGRWHAAAGISAILATDIVLPVPSSVLMAWAGKHSGIVIGTLACWIGTTTGALFGFALSRRWGRPLALKFSKESALDEMSQQFGRWGSLVLLITRPIPVFAEAAVLLMGVHQLPWREFLPPILLGNLGVCIAFVALGNVAESYGWFPMAMCLAAGLPLLLTYWFGRRGRKDALV